LTGGPLKKTNSIASSFGVSDEAVAEIVRIAGGDQGKLLPIEITVNEAGKLQDKVVLLANVCPDQKKKVFREVANIAVFARGRVDLLAGKELHFEHRTDFPDLNGNFDPKLGGGGFFLFDRSGSERCIEKVSEFFGEPKGVIS
jgi:hypothetical protein